MTVSYIKRFARLILGLFLYALGIYFQLQANLGLAPWNALSQGLGVVSGISMGTMNSIISMVILAIVFICKEKIGFGTVCNAVLIGTFLDIFILLELLPTMDSLGWGLVVQLIGLTIIGFASYLYIGAGMGCGPRDGLMVALCKRFPKTPVGFIRSCLEGTVLVVGWLCGGIVGVGTVVAVFGLGAIIEMVFRLFHFDVKAIVHENLLDTLNIWRGR